MNQIEQACLDRWCALKSCVDLMKMKKQAGFSTFAERTRANELLFELRLYYDSGLMPERVRTEYESKINPTIERLLQ